MGRDALSLLEEAADELENIYDYEYSWRHKYPFQQKKYDGAMKFVLEIREWIKNNS